MTEQNTEKKPEQDREQPEQPPRRGTTSAVVAWIALLVAAIALAGGFYLEKEREKLKDRITDLRYELRETENELMQRDADFVRSDALDRLERETSERLDALDRRARNLDSEVESLHRRTEGVTADWVYAEIEHVLTLASWQLEIDRDPAPALAALRAAQRRLQDSGLPGAARLTARIEQDISELERVELPDRYMIAMTLDGISNRLDDLPLLQPEGVREERERARGRRESGEPGINWSRLWRRIRQSFHSMVTVRRGERPTAVLLPPEEEYFVYLNTQLKLESARAALMRNDTQSYRSALRSARSWIEAWFDTDDTTVTTVLEELRALEQHDLEPELPDLSGTLQMLGRAGERRSGD